MKRALAVGVLAMTGLVLAGCPKKTPPAEGEDAGAGTTGVIIDAKKVAPAASGSATGTAAAASATFGGKYRVSAGAMYVPEHKDWSSVKFKNDESKLLGDGEMTLAIDPAGRVSGGTEGGPLGASVIDGRREGESVNATIRRKDPSDDGLTGTLVAKLSGDGTSLDGTMKLAESNAAVVRVGKLEAKKK